MGSRERQVDTRDKAGRRVHTVCECNWTARHTNLKCALLGVEDTLVIECIHGAPWRPNQEQHVALKKLRLELHRLTCIGQEDVANDTVSTQLADI